MSHTPPDTPSCENGVAGTSADAPSDRWSHWLLHARHGDDPALEKTYRAGVQLYAKRVLEGAKLSHDMTLADIGSGEGLIAFHAIERIGPSLQVLLTDVSAPLLRHAEAIAVDRGIRQQCSFIECRADNLSAIPDGFVDAVTTRAVLAYVTNKVAALREFHRILKPGGRLSLAEPIFFDDALAASMLRTQIEKGLAGPIGPLVHRWKAAQFPDTPERMSASPITDFSERTLFEMIRACGFTHLHLELHIDLIPNPIASWETFLNTSPHPLAPTLREILAKQFNAAERAALEAALRGNIESGRSEAVDRTAYFTALKPS